MCQSPYVGYYRTLPPNKQQSGVDNFTGRWDRSLSKALIFLDEGPVSTAEIFREK